MKCIIEGGRCKPDTKAICVDCPQRTSDVDKSRHKPTIITPDQIPTLKVRREDSARSPYPPVDEQLKDEGLL